MLRQRLARPLTLSEKVLYTHLRNPHEQRLERDKSSLLLDPDRTACHDATATMAMLQFISVIDSKMLRGETLNLITNKIAVVPEVAKSYRDSGVRWCIVGDWNYGEGSSREHAALEPRYLGGEAVIARSFARIHETNLKKQGMLPLTFADPTKYDKINIDDKIDILGADALQPGKNLILQVRNAGGESWKTELVHTYHEGQIPWLAHGSALNYIKAARKTK